VQNDAIAGRATRLVLKRLLQLAVMTVTLAAGSAHSEVRRDALARASIRAGTRGIPADSLRPVIALSAAAAMAAYAAERLVRAMNDDPGIR